MTTANELINTVGTCVLVRGSQITGEVLEILSAESDEFPAAYLVSGYGWATRDQIRLPFTFR